MITGKEVSSSIIVKGIDGRDFKVQYIPIGGRYGRNYSFVAKEELVEFYDMQTNQFVSRYATDTIMRNDYPRGLDLERDIDVWKIPAKGMEEVIDWIGDIEVYGMKEKNRMAREIKNNEIQLKEGQTVLDVDGNEYLIEKGDSLGSVKKISEGSYYSFPLKRGTDLMEGLRDLCDDHWHATGRVITQINIRPMLIAANQTFEIEGDFIEEPDDDYFL